VNDLTPSLASTTISYLEFTQGMINSKTIMKEIYEPTFSPKVFASLDALKEIAQEQAPASLLNATLIKKQGKKKPKGEKESKK